MLLHLTNDFFMIGIPVSIALISFLIASFIRPRVTRLMSFCYNRAIAGIKSAMKSKNKTHYH